MPRVVKPAAVRQEEILDLAERLFFERGYDDTPIQAIIDAVGIAKGTFYHHYPSKGALLDGVVRRYQDRAFAMADAIVADPSIDGLEKLRRIYSRVGHWKVERRDVMIALHRAMSRPSNASMYARLQREGIAAVIPSLQRIVIQAAEEGLVHTRHPAQVARMVLELSSGVSLRLGDALLGDPAQLPTLAEVLQEVDACEEAVSLLLGIPHGSLPLFDKDDLALWLDAARSPNPA